MNIPRRFFSPHLLIVHLIYSALQQHSIPKLILSIFSEVTHCSRNPTWRPWWLELGMYTLLCFTAIQCYGDELTLFATLVVGIRRHPSARSLSGISDEFRNCSMGTSERRKLRAPLAAWPHLLLTRFSF